MNADLHGFFFFYLCSSVFICVYLWLIGKLSGG